MLLFENRGGTNVSNLGLGLSSSNLIYTVFTEDLNLTQTPIKFCLLYTSSDGVMGCE